MTKLTPCIEYDDVLDVASMEQVKLELGGRSKKIAKFSAKHGVEGLFHVNDQFMKAATRLNFQAADYRDQFENCYNTTADWKWQNHIQGIVGGRTCNHFVHESLNFVHNYTGDDNPRDTHNCLRAYVAVLR